MGYFRKINDKNGKLKNISNAEIQKMQKKVNENAKQLYIDKYGNTIYDKSSNANQYARLVKMGNNVFFSIDETQLVNSNIDDIYKDSDFVENRIQEIYDVVYNQNLKNDFNENGDKTMYLIQEQQDRKNKFINDNIKEIV